jgi:hypothetical protein
MPRQAVEKSSRWFAGGRESHLSCLAALLKGKSGVGGGVLGEAAKSHTDLPNIFSIDSHPGKLQAQKRAATAVQIAVAAPLAQSARLIIRHF